MPEHKYINCINLLEYSYEKFHVTSARELRYHWQEYMRIVDEERRVKRVGDMIDLFTREMVQTLKNNGIQDQNIIPMIKEFCVCDVQDGKIRLEALVCCQNPSLNPMQIVAAVELHIPQLKPDYSSFQRLEIYDQNMNVFR